MKVMSHFVLTEDKEINIANFITEHKSNRQCL